MPRNGSELRIGLAGLAVLWLLGGCGTLGCVNQGRRVTAPSKLKLLKE